MHQKVRINLSLNPDEARGLISLADNNCRHPREEARFILRQALKEHRLLLDKPGQTAVMSEMVIAGGSHEPE